MNHYSKGSFSIVGFNWTAKCKDWNLPGGTGISITKNIASRKDKSGSGCDETGLGR